MWKKDLVALLAFAAALTIFVSSVTEYKTGKPSDWSIQNGVRVLSAPSSAKPETGLQYRVSIPPLPLEFGDHQAAVELAIRQGLAFWNARGYSMLETPSNLSTVAIQYVRDWGTEELGQHYRGLVQLGLGDSRCNGQWTPWDEDTLRHVATHELGHAIGLPHSQDPDDIMYPYAPITYSDPCQLARDQAVIRRDQNGTAFFRLGAIPTASPFHPPTGRITAAITPVDKLANACLTRFNSTGPDLVRCWTPTTKMFTIEDDVPTWGEYWLSLRCVEEPPCTIHWDLYWYQVATQ